MIKLNRCYDCKADDFPMAESLYHTKKNTKDAAINLLKETCIGSVYYAVQERMDHGAIFMLNCLAEVMVGKS